MLADKMVQFQNRYTWYNLTTPDIQSNSLLFCILSEDKMDGRNCWKTMVPSENCVLKQCWRTNFLNSKTSHLTHDAWNWNPPYLYVVFNTIRELCPNKKMADKMVQLQNNTLNIIQRWLTLKSTLPWISIQHHQRIVSDKKWRTKWFNSKTLHVV